jgi:hypothetical protein
MLIRIQYRPTTPTNPARMVVKIGNKETTRPAALGDYNMYLTALAEVLEDQGLAIVGFPELLRTNGRTKHFQVKLQPATA